MRQALRALMLSGIVALLSAGATAPLHGQATAPPDAEQRFSQARRAAGLRAGIWKVDVAVVDQVTRSPQFEAYYQRGLDRHLALESSFGLWRVKTAVAAGDPEAPPVETRTYIAPLLTSIKYYPLTGPVAALEPYLMAGIGFAFGVEDESERAIGGGGTTVVTGIGLRVAVGLEMALGGPLGIAAAGKYQWVYFGEELINTKHTFSGVGVEGGVTYRLQF